MDLPLRRGLRAQLRPHSTLQLLSEIPYNSPVTTGPQGRSVAAHAKQPAQPASRPEQRTRRVQRLYDVESWDTADDDKVPSTSTSGRTSNGSGTVPGQAAVRQSSSSLPDGWGVVVPSTPSAAKAAPAGGTGKKSKSPYLGLTSNAGKLSLTLLQRKLVSDGKLTREDVDELRQQAVQQQQQEPRRNSKKALAALTAAAALGKDVGKIAAAKRQRKLLPGLDVDDSDYYDEEEDEEVLDGSGGEQTPDFELAFGDDGTEYTEYDGQGNVKAVQRREGPTQAEIDAVEVQREGEDGEQDELDFLDDDDEEGGAATGAQGWASLANAAATSGRAATAPAPSSKARTAGDRAAAIAALTSRPRRDRQRSSHVTTVTPAAAGSSSSSSGNVLTASSLNALQADVAAAFEGGAEGLNDDEDIEWGLDELAGRGQGRTSLMEELGLVKRRKKATPAPGKAAKPAMATAGAAVSGLVPPPVPGQPQQPQQGQDAEADDGDDEDVAVLWGGTGGGMVVDFDAQEQLLSRLFKPHKVRELMSQQREAVDEYTALRNKSAGRKSADKAYSNGKMRIIGGTAAGKVLSLPVGGGTRPMMQKVRQAIFNMIQSASGQVDCLPSTARWLDLFAGTGSVGLEALSRGVGECHFIEMDAWTCRKVLGRNITTLGFNQRAVVHTSKAEDFLRRAKELPRFAGGPFDFISVCPPYLLVSYPELMGLLDGSPLVHERSIVFVEYPKQLAHQVPATLGQLTTMRDRKYGRTWVRVYASPSSSRRALDSGTDDERALAADDNDDDLDDL